MWRCAALLIVVAACHHADPPPPPQPPLPADLVASANARLDTLRARSIALANLDATIDPDAWTERPDLGGCPFHLEKPASLAALDATLGGEAPYPLEIVRDGDAMSLPGPVMSDKLQALESAIATEVRITADSDAERDQQIQTLQTLVATPAPDVAVVFVVDQWHDASFELQSVSGDFQGGEVTGRAYLWSADKGAVVCVADVDATSSPTMRVPVGNTSVDAYYGRNDRDEIRTALDNDLRTQLAVAIADQMTTAAGPPQAVAKPRKRH